MWRFVLKENIRRYEALLERADGGAQEEQLRKLLKEAELELDELETASTPELARSDAALKLFAEHCVEDALKINRAQFSTLQIFDPERDALMILAQRNFRAAFLHHLALMRPGDGSACGRCLDEGRLAAIEDVNSDPRFEPHRKAALDARFEAVHACPVPSGSGELIAVLSSYFSSPQHFSEGDLDRAGRFAETVGTGLDRHLPI